MGTDGVRSTDLCHLNPSIHHAPPQPSINPRSLPAHLESVNMGQSSSTSRAEIRPVETPPARSHMPLMASDVTQQLSDTATGQSQEQTGSRRLRRRTRNVISQGPGSIATPISSHNEPGELRSGGTQVEEILDRSSDSLEAPHQDSTDPSLSHRASPGQDSGQVRPSTVRQSSYMTRMASRLMPRYTTASSTGSEDDSREEGRAVRRRLSDRLSSGPDIQFDPVRYDASIQAERRRRLIQISNRTPLEPLHQTAQGGLRQLEESLDGAGSLAGAVPIEPPTSASGPTTLNSAAAHPQHAPRLSNLRNSIHLSLTRFATPPDRASIFHETDTESEPHRLQVSAAASDTFLPRLPTPNLGLDLDPTRVMTPLHVTNPTPVRPPTPPPRRLTPPPPSDRDIRRLPHALRGGPTRPRPGEDQAAMLSRLLSHAAALTAVSLVGDNQHALSDARDVGGDNVDGSFEGFLQALQNGRLAAALRNGGSEMGGGSAAASGEANVTPVNFFRMFRFGTIGSGNGGNTTSNNSNPVGRRLRRHQNQTSPGEVSNENDESRMVPVIIVGIRSMTSEEGAERDGGNATPPFFDMLQDLAMEDEAPRGRAGSFLRRTDGRSRFSRPRRPSLSSTFPANYDSQRHHRGNTISSTNSQPEALPSASAGTSLMSLPTVLSDTPPGPNPPPSTPADPSLSALSSGTTTPNRQSSVSSATQTPISPGHTREGGARRQTSIFEPTEEETHAAPRNPRRRRLSDSEFSRYRNYGLGSSRRNGIVGDSGPSTEGTDPDSGRSRRGQTETTNRSWIIYVLGGSYPEDHPILTTPSLFTDVS